MTKGFFESLIFHALDRDVKFVRLVCSRHEYANGILRYLVYCVKYLHMTRLATPYSFKPLQK